MRIIAFIILYITCAQLKAQVNSFNRTPRFDSINISFGFNVFQVDNSYIVTGGNVEYPSTKHGVFSASFDSTGKFKSIIKVQSVYDTVQFYSGGVKSAGIGPDSNIYMAGVSYCTNPNTQWIDCFYGVLYKFNKDGELLDTFFYSTPNDWLNFHYLVLTADNNIILLGEYGVYFTPDSANYDAIAIKVDLEGNEIWRKTWGGEKTDRFYQAVATADSGMLVGYGTRSLPVPNSTIQKAHVVKIDKDGNEQWRQEIRPGISAVQSVSVRLNTLDKGFVIFCSDFFSQSDASFYYLYRTDSLLNVLWDFSFQLYDGSIIQEVWQAYENRDSTIILCGQTDYANYGWVTKFDKQGHQLWEGRYSTYTLDTQFLDYYIADIKQTTDGGWICTGAAQDTIGAQVAWLLKLDSNGCVENTCPQIIWDDVTYFSPDVRSTVKVFPNPATNTLQVAYEHMASDINTMFSMYDVTGRKMLGQPLSNSNQLIDISQLPPGLYLWQVTDKTGIVISAGKVVVQ